MSAIVTGDKEIDRKLAALKQSAQNKIARPALAKCVRISAKAMKSEVPANLKDAKKAIGFKVKVKGSDEVVAKAGAGVGVKKASLKKQVAKQALKRAGRPGVGISAADIHWFIMGTGPRATTKSTQRHATSGQYVKGKGTSGGHSTGAMPPQMPDVIKGGYRKSEQEAFNALKDEARKRIEETVK